MGNVKSAEPSATSAPCATHSPYAFPSGSVPPACTDGHEELLVQVAVRFLNDARVNPFQCNIPVERLQSQVAKQCADLYAFVVGTQGWRAFLLRHPSVFVVTFNPTRGTLVRLGEHQDWQRGDELEQAGRSIKHRCALDWLIGHLAARTLFRDTVDNIIATYTEHPHRSLLPARGDFLRLVRKHPNLFCFSERERVLALRLAADGRPVALLRSTTRSNGGVALGSQAHGPATAHAHGHAAGTPRARGAPAATPRRVMPAAAAATAAGPSVPSVPLRVTVTPVRQPPRAIAIAPPSPPSPPSPRFDFPSASSGEFSSRQRRGSSPSLSMSGAMCPASLPPVIALTAITASQFTSFMSEPPFERS